MMNVIDRAQMDWHNENKHTMLLAKSVNIGTDGTEYLTITSKGSASNGAVQ